MKNTPIRAELLHILRRATEPVDHEELSTRVIAAIFPAFQLVTMAADSHEQLRRSVDTVLDNLAFEGLAEKDGHGRWSLKREGGAA